VEFFWTWFWALVGGWVLIKIGILLFQRKALHDGFKLLNHYGGGDLKRDREPGFVFGRKR
jgi:hypothetical protein